MTTPHIHAEVIKAWADGATIQHWDTLNLLWVTLTEPSWFTNTMYRVKPPEPKKIKMWNALYKSGTSYMCSDCFYATEEKASKKFGSHFIQLLPHTEIELEVTE